MKRFIVDHSFWELFPEAKLGVLLLKNYNGLGESSPEIKALLEESHKLAEEHIDDRNFSDSDVVQTYRKAYQKFKTKKGVRSSIEALLKRVANGQKIPSIDPLVDIYNAASLRFGLPVGAEDSDRFVGDLQLTITDGDDEFFLIGDDKNSPTLPNELCYKDGSGAVCRCLNWRDGERTMIQPHTKNAFVVIEMLNPADADRMQEALTFMEGQAKLQLRAETEIHILDKHFSSIML
ncbi:B3/B4 domain-containing protein [Streptococcus hongkongensis]